MSAGPLLVTGFGPFAGVERNPSSAVAEALAAEPGVWTEVLPVAYGRAERRLEALLAELRPVAVLLFGAHGEPGFRLERVAKNLDTGRTDVDGEVRDGSAVREGGPDAYWSTLPLREIGGALDQLGLAWEWSSDAGGFLCNHAFFTARHACAGRVPAVPCGLVHVPSVEDTPLSAQVIAARACLDALRAQLSAGFSGPSAGPRG